MNLKNMSVIQLRNLAVKANSLADDLEKEQPSYQLALENGIRDRSYHTVRYGTVAYYEGEAIIEMANGKKWKAIGHRSSGGAEVAIDGYIEFIPMDN